MKFPLLLTFRLFAFFAAPNLLPEQLPIQYLTKQGFISFQEPEGGFKPFFASLSINGVLVRSSSAPQVSQLFSDSTFAQVPYDRLIQKTKDSSGREVWNYPIGTEVAHLIQFKDLSHTLFELRILRKISETQWDFASYSPNATQAQETFLSRNHYSGNAPLSLILQMSDHLSARIDLKRISLNACKNCHFSMSIAAYQYPTANEAGPCGFTPGNENGIRAWIDTYQAHFGHSPFQHF